MKEPCEFLLIMSKPLPELQSLTDQIDTGTENPETSRALVVFNLTDQPLSGVAVFHALMSWPRDVPLPPVTVTDFNGQCVPSVIRDLMTGPDAKGRADRSQLSFAIHFSVSDVPASGWCIFIAAYTDAFAPTLEHFAETPGLTVIETTRHGGDLPPRGILET